LGKLKKFLVNRSGLSVAATRSARSLKIRQKAVRVTRQCFVYCNSSHGWWGDLRPAVFRIISHSGRGWRSARHCANLRRLPNGVEVTHSLCSASDWDVGHFWVVSWKLLDHFR